MNRLSVKTRSGEILSIVGETGITVMEVIRNADIEELSALCGGSCSCATCHVYIPPEFHDLLPAMNEYEDGLLDTTEHRTPASRLSCQLIFEESMADLTITIAPEG